MGRRTCVASNSEQADEDFHMVCGGQAWAEGGENPCREVAYHEKGEGQVPSKVKRASVLWGSLW